MKIFPGSRWVILALLALLIASCGGGGNGDANASDPANPYGRNPGVGTQSDGWTLYAEPHPDAGSGNTYFGPQSIAGNLATGDVYVSGTVYDAPADHKLYRIDLNGGIADLSGPWNNIGNCYLDSCSSLQLAVGNDGRVYAMPDVEPGSIGGLTVFGGDRVYVLDRAGALQKTILLGGLFQGPLTVDASGNLYLFKLGSMFRIGQDGSATFVAGASWGTPSRSSEGTLLNPAGTGTDGAGAAASFYSPLSLAVDRDGNVYVSEISAIRKVTPDGIVSTLAGKFAPYDEWVTRRPTDGTGSQAAFQFAAGITFAGGSLYVMDVRVLRRVTLGGVVTSVGPTPVSTKALAASAASLYSFDPYWNIWAKAVP